MIGRIIAGGRRRPFSRRHCWSSQFDESDVVLLIRGRGRVEAPRRNLVQVYVGGRHHDINRTFLGSCLCSLLSQDD